MKISKVCQGCGNKFFVFPYLKNTKKFCSWSCRYSSRIKKICKNCKKEYFVKPSKKDKTSFCSRKCQGISNTGKICSNEFRQKMSRAMKGIRKSDLTRKKISDIWKQKYASGYRPSRLGYKMSEESKKKLSEIRKKLIRDDPSFLKRILSCDSPNKYEKFLLQLIDNDRLPYKYVGNGEFILAGKNPDFINVNGQKKIIELAGEFWHTKKQMKERETLFTSYGFKTLTIWCKELKNKNEIVNKIRRFEYEI